MATTYSRKNHQKSRQGCLECKARHRKCDETLPTCLQCARSRPPRVCRYDSSITQSQLAGRNVTNTQSPHSECRCLESQKHESDAINTRHMHLVHHWLTNAEILSLADQSHNHILDRAYAFGIGTEHPFLLYAILALSARHLAHVESKDSAYHSSQAISLQTKALTLFRSSFATIDSTNCVPILLFSITLGHHLLADALSHRSNDLDGFLDHYIQCLGTHRGVKEITMVALPSLQLSELGPIIANSMKFTSRTPTGDECNSLLDAIDREVIDHDAKEIYKTTIKYLQLSFDAMHSHSAEQAEMIFLWVVLVPIEFMTMLAERRSYTIIILAYYAVVLCHGRHHWQVGDVGSYLFTLIEEYLGTEWETQLGEARRLL